MLIFKGWLSESNSDTQVKLMLYVYICIFIPENEFKTKGIIAVFKLKPHFRDLLELYGITIVTGKRSSKRRRRKTQEQIDLYAGEHTFPLVEIRA